MTTLEHEPVPATTAPVLGYDASRYNALTHGILSRLVVMAHENADEFADLLAAMLAEYQPEGMTERILIEELAGIIWRKRRVMLAEKAAINRGLHVVVTSTFSSPIPTAAPFEPGLTTTTGGRDLPDLLTATPAEIAERQRYAALDLDATRKAAAILRRGGENVYQRARRALLTESRDWWDEHVDEESYPATAEGLADFIRASLEPICRSQAQEARLIPAIQAQAAGEGLQLDRLERLGRYETHLDRKFERTLSMILKLRELRGA